MQWTSTRSPAAVAATSWSGPTSGTGPEDWQTEETLLPPDTVPHTPATDISLWLLMILHLHKCPVANSPSTYSHLSANNGTYIIFQIWPLGGQKFVCKLLWACSTSKNLQQTSVYDMCKDIDSFYVGKISMSSHQKCCLTHAQPQSSSTILQCSNTVLLSFLQFVEQEAVVGARDLTVSAAAICTSLPITSTVILLRSDICAETENFLCQLNTQQCSASHDYLLCTYYYYYYYYRS